MKSSRLNFDIQSKGGNFELTLTSGKLFPQEIPSHYEALFAEKGFAAASCHSTYSKTTAKDPVR